MSETYSPTLWSVWTKYVAGYSLSHVQHTREVGVNAYVGGGPGGGFTCVSAANRAGRECCRQEAGLSQHPSITVSLQLAPICHIKGRRCELVVFTCERGCPCDEALHNRLNAPRQQGVHTALSHCWSFGLRHLLVDRS